MKPWKKERWFGDNSLYKQKILYKLDDTQIQKLCNLIKRMKGQKIPQKIIHKRILGKLN